MSITIKYRSCVPRIPKDTEFGHSEAGDQGRCCCERGGEPGVTQTSATRITAPADHSGPRERARRIARSPTRAALVTALAVGAVVTLTPANGAASNLATGFVRAVRHLAATSGGQAFAGTPAVGVLFTTSAGKLGQHFCTASVVDSPAGDLAITAAHCVTSTSGTIDFVPGYDNGRTPYGVWTVTKVYVDRAWNSSSNPDDDFAFLRISQPGSSVPVEDETGAEKLATGTPASHQLVQAIGYPNSSDQPITCQNWLREPMAEPARVRLRRLHGRDQRRAVPERGQPERPGRAW